MTIGPGDEGCWKRIGVWRHSGDPCERLEEYFHCHHCPVFSQMARQVLGRPAVDNPTFETVEDLEVSETVRDTIETFVVKIGDALVGFPRGLINQVMGFSRIHSIPNRHSQTIKGLVNIDGEIKICISLGRLLNIEAGNKNKNNNAQNAIHERLVSIATASGEWILPVSAVIGHQSLTASGEGNSRELQRLRYISSILMSDGKPVLLVDGQALDSGLLNTVGGLYG